MFGFCNAGCFALNLKCFDILDKFVFCSAQQFEKQLWVNNKKLNEQFGRHLVVEHVCLCLVESAYQGFSPLSQLNTPPPNLTQPSPLVLSLKVCDHSIRVDGRAEFTLK